jgi:putative RNA 2'-phosphotransferase
MDNRRLVRMSKFLAKHLRHSSEALGLTLAPGGWVNVADLLAACAGVGFPITRDELEDVVAHNNKRRFSFDSAGTRIRANQGHSTEVDLQLSPADPPAVLYHGTGRSAVEAILAQGLMKMARHHVHLSRDVETARSVGARHGSPVVFAVDAAAMVADGYVFYLSDNGVWLVDHVPPNYLKRLQVQSGPTASVSYW